MRQVGRRPDRVQLVVRKRRRAGWINVAFENRFAGGNVTARQHESNGNVELVALEIGFVVARHHPHVDAGMRAIEAHVTEVPATAMQARSLW